MNKDEDTIHGKKITAEEALKELGDPSTWAEFSKKAYHEFTAKPDLTEMIEKLTADYNRVADTLTKSQLVEAIRQALACGDFQRNVVVSTETSNIRQQVVYIPYRELERAKSKIHGLEQLLDFYRPNWRCHEEDLEQLP